MLYNLHIFYTHTHYIYINMHIYSMYMCLKYTYTQKYIHKNGNMFYFWYDFLSNSLILTTKIMFFFLMYQGLFFLFSSWHLLSQSLLLSLSTVFFQHTFFFKLISMTVYSFPSILDYVCCINLMFQVCCFFFAPVRRKGALCYVCIPSLIHSVLSTTLKHEEDFFCTPLDEKVTFFLKFKLKTDSSFMQHCDPPVVMLLNTIPGCSSSEDSLLTIPCLLLGGIDNRIHYPILSPQEIWTARNAFS